MTEDVKDQQPNDDEELNLLKARAKQLNLKFHWNIGLEKLRAQVNEALAPKKEAPPLQSKAQRRTAAEAEWDRNYKFTPVAADTKKSEAAKLIRIRVTCMNPNKTDYEGDIFSVSNSKYGFKKYVPFNNAEGWHVPNMIYQHMLERKCQIFYNKKDSKGNMSRHGKIINEFSIEVMDPLTQTEFKELAQRQAMASGTEAE